LCRRYKVSPMKPSNLMRMMRVFAKSSADAQTSSLMRSEAQVEIRVGKNVENMGHRLGVWGSRLEGRRSCVVSTVCSKVYWPIRCHCSPYVPMESSIK
jgi:hypothetical protein